MPICSGRGFHIFSRVCGPIASAIVDPARHHRPMLAGRGWPSHGLAGESEVIQAGSSKLGIEVPCDEMTARSTRHLPSAARAYSLLTS